MGMEKSFDDKQKKPIETFEIHEDPYKFLGIDPSATDAEVSAICREIDALWVSQVEDEVHDIDSARRVEKALRTVLTERGLLR